ncbi:MAG: DUF4340 domain-containing protein [Alphaproteobacteria bacterium]|nr:DUF4340 domain-containing protein [Alphaproteobacteria bacterium]
MKARHFVILTLASASVAIGAVVALQEGRETSRPLAAQGLLVPGFIDRVNDVDRLTINSRSDGQVTLERKAERWSVAERHNYPADLEKVRPVLLQIAQLKTVEALTSNPELHKRLQVEAIDAPDSASVRLTASLGAAVQADLIVGKTRADQRPGVFVRKADEARVWAAEGTLQPEKRVVHWLDRNILNVDSRRVAAIRLAHGDGERLDLEKAAPGDRDQALVTPVPGGQVAKAAHELNAVASIPDFLILEDVRPKAEVNFAAPATTASFVTFDGLELSFRLVEQDGQSWVEAKAATATPWPGLDEFIKAAPEGSDAASTAKLMKPAVAVAQEVAEINARVAGWAYRVTDYKTGKLKSRLADLIEPKKEEEKKDDDKKG